MTTCDQCKRPVFLCSAYFIEHNYKLPQRDNQGNLLFMKERTAILCCEHCYACFRGDK